MPKPIYLDYQSTSPVDPLVLDAMLPFFSSEFGNAASTTHSFGWAATKAVEASRALVAAGFGAQAREIVFTSGATESNHLAILGLLETYESARNHLITTAAEHSSVLEVFERAARRGASVTVLPVDPDGRVTAEQIRQAITDKTLLISVIFANNEVGSINPVADIGRMAKERDVFFHSDASQIVSQGPLKVDELGVDLLSFSGHKIYGPKGVGGLYVRSQNPRVRLAAQQVGGGHERGLRSGTLNVPGIIGLGKAMELIATQQPAESQRIEKLRDDLLTGIRQGFPEVILNGHPSERLSGNLSLSFPGFAQTSILSLLAPHLAVSTGSACASATGKPSHVLKAMGLPDSMVKSTLRFGLGRFTKEPDVKAATGHLLTALRKLRSQP